MADPTSLRTGTPPTEETAVEKPEGIFAQGERRIESRVECTHVGCTGDDALGP